MSTRFDSTLFGSRAEPRASARARTAGLALGVALLMTAPAFAQAPAPAAPAPAAPAPAAPAPAPAPAAPAKPAKAPKKAAKPAEPAAAAPAAAPAAAAPAAAAPAPAAAPASAPAPAPAPAAPAPAAAAPAPAAPAPVAPAPAAVVAAPAAAPLAAEPAPGGLPASYQYPAAAPTTVAAAEKEPSKIGVPSEQAQFFMGYEIGLPTGSLGNFTSDASFRGFDMGGLWPVWRGLYLGPVFSHHTFTEHEGTNTYIDEERNGAITADVYTYARFWTMAGVARYHFLPPDAFVRPYVGLRLGMNFVTAATLVADLSIYYEPLGFALSPEAGLLIRAASIMHINIGLRYDFSTASSGPLDNASFLPFHLGLVFHKKP